MDRPRLAVLIPAHREGGTIGPVVAGATAFGEVIVVDDGSPDDTGARAAAAGATVVRNDPGRGYDGALDRAFAAAIELGFTHAVTMDADGEHDPARLAEFRRLLLEERARLVLGVRRRKQRLAEIVMGLYIRARFGPRDILCGMKGYDLRLVADNGGFDHTGSIGTEVAIAALRRGVPFSEVRVTGTPRTDAPRFDRRLRANWRILRALWRAMRRGPGVRPRRDPPPLSVLSGRTTP